MALVLVAQASFQKVSFPFLCYCKGAPRTLLSEDGSPPALGSQWDDSWTATIQFLLFQMPLADDRGEWLQPPTMGFSLYGSLQGSPQQPQPRSPFGLFHTPHQALFYLELNCGHRPHEPLLYSCPHPKQASRPQRLCICSSVLFRPTDCCFRDTSSPGSPPS